MNEVKRCGYYLVGNHIHCKEILIPWEDDKQVCRLYPTMFAEKLGKDLYPMTDTTSYATSFNGKNLSVYKKELNGHKLTQFTDKLKESEYVPGLFEYLYITSLTTEDIQFIRRTKCFFNIFQNPDKQKFSEALACVTYKCLEQQNKLDYLSDKEKFVYWSMMNIGTMEIERV